MSGETHIESQKVLPDEPFPHDETMPAWMTADEMPDDVQKEFGIGAYEDKSQTPDE